RRLGSRDPDLPRISPSAGLIDRLVPRRAVEVGVLGSQLHQQRADVVPPCRRAPVGNRREDREPAAGLEYAPDLLDRSGLVEPVKSVGHGDRLHGAVLERMASATPSRTRWAPMPA